MAKGRQDLAKSMVARIPPSPVRVEVLYVQRGTSPAGHEFPAHAHPFWQLEIALSGRFRCSLGGDRGEDLLLAPGDGLLIPAGVAHGFGYPRRSRHVSFKARVEGVAAPAAPLALGVLPGWPGLRDALVALVDHERPDRHRQHATGHLLAAVVALATAPAPEREVAPSLVEQVRALVEHGENRRWSVATVARTLGYSPGHASSRFRAQAAMTLKSFLDQARQEAATRLLADTPRAIGEIAELLEFPDVFAFSRFVKRVAGVSPRALRERLHHDRR
jgi:AraC-like DNA-binding protein/quercetin dioxygenase-like cupin family protein